MSAKCATRNSPGSVIAKDTRSSTVAKGNLSATESSGAAVLGAATDALHETMLYVVIFVLRLDGIADDL